jgi:hypothetical protein
MCGSGSRFWFYSYLLSVCLLIACWHIHIYIQYILFILKNIGAAIIDFRVCPPLVKCKGFIDTLMYGFSSTGVTIYCYFGLNFNDNTCCEVICKRRYNDNTHTTGPYTRSCKAVVSENTYISGAPDSGGQYKWRRRRRDLLSLLSGHGVVFCQQNRKIIYKSLSLCKNVCNSIHELQALV